MPTVTYISSHRLLRAYATPRSRRRFRRTPDIEFTEPVFARPSSRRRFRDTAAPEIIVHGGDSDELAVLDRPRAATDPIDVEASIREVLETGPPPKPEEPIGVDIPLYAAVYLEHSAA